MNEQPDPRTDPASDFLKHWQDTFSRLFQVAGTFTPETVPPEMLRQIRSGMFQALAKSWEEFMRSPQFLEGMKQMMDNAIAFRRMTADFLTQARQEMQSPTRQDVDDTLLVLREMEGRLTRRIDELAARLEGHDGGNKGRPADSPGGRARRVPPSRRSTAKRS